MKYMLLIYSNPAMAEARGQDLEKVGSDVDALIAELTETGEWVGGEGLADPMNAKSIRVREGVPVVTDGPFVEAKEYLAGYCLFECETEERAIEIAARWPDASYHAVELRPLMAPAGLEM